MVQILVVEDEQPFREFLEKKLTKEGYQVMAVGTGKEALSEIRHREYDVAILDISLPDKSGLEILKEIQDLQLGTECIMLTGYASVESAIEAMKIGAYDYLEKPAKIKEIKLVVNRAYEKCRMHREIHHIKEERKRAIQMYKMVGDSEAIEKVRTMVTKVARTDSSVLIEGESGTGKELVAREIHRLSNRWDASFISLDCGAIQESLFENELFGHAKGAYTSANAKQVGLVELADGGTLFIDEVGELEGGLQKKFLRFLESGEFRHLGDSKLRHVNVRVIAATNRTLKEMVEEGKFRQDLYYRLDVIKIQVPPLRDRKEDLPKLAEHFLKMSPLPQGKLKKIHPEVLDIFFKYRWPGNIRELKNVIERALILSGGDTITIEDIPPLYIEESDDAIETMDVPSGDFKNLSQIEREHIHRALLITDGNKTQAAKILGISLRSLYRKLEKYDLG